MSDIFIATLLINLSLKNKKVFVMDDEIIISGGNLSTEYFVDRQDRYIHFGDAGNNYK